MRNQWIRFIAFIKMLLGICCSNKCHEKATVTIEIPIVKIRRCLCTKHYIELEKKIRKDIISRV